ncbi:branched-chain amino acid transport system II carrier protein [Pigmentibacter ruber]
MLNQGTATVPTWKVFIAGFAAFAMFFGSGNLVFPLKMGSDTQSNWIFSAVGLSITGVVVPLLGLVALTFLKGSQDAFFRWFGKKGALILPFLILLLIGPFGVVPRCITVGYGAWQSFAPSTPLWLFALSCIGVILLATISDRKIVDIIGKYFTPFKLGALALVIGGSLYFAVTSTDVLITTSQTTPLNAFKAGFFEGYNTMDLMAAIFFGVSLVYYFKPENSDKIPYKSTLLAMSLGMFLLMLVYIALVYLGAAYSSQVSHLPGPQILPNIARIALGEASDYLISFTLVVSCLTTAVALTSVSVDFLKNKIKPLNGRRTTTLLICLAVTYVIALTDFTGIMAFMAPILEFFYPVIIVLAIVNIIVSLVKNYKQNSREKNQKEAA